MWIRDLYVQNSYPPAAILDFQILQSPSRLLSNMYLINGNDIFLAIPLPPGAPDVVDWSERHMDLKWQEPLDDGGAAVTSYHIEVTIIFD